MAHECHLLGIFDGEYFLDFLLQHTRRERKISEGEARKTQRIRVEAVALQEKLPNVPVNHLLAEGARDEDDWNARVHNLKRARSP